MTTPTEIRARYPEVKYFVYLPPGQKGPTTTKNWQRPTHETTDSELSGFLNNDGGCGNIGALLGKDSGVDCFDIDHGKIALPILFPDGIMPNTLIEKRVTPEGEEKYHIFVKHCNKLRSMKRDAEGWEYLADANQVFLSPRRGTIYAKTEHEKKENLPGTINTGNPWPSYTIINNSPIAEIPEDLLARLETFAGERLPAVNLAELKKGLLNGKQISKGDRHKMALRLVNYYMREALPENEILKKMEEWNALISEPLSLRDFEHDILSVHRLIERTGKPYGYKYYDPDESFDKQFADAATYAIKNADFMELAKKFYDKLPYYYDKSGGWWLWNTTTMSYVFVDETDLLGKLYVFAQNSAITGQKIKSEFLTAMKITGRMHEPQEPPREWVQFNNQVVNVLTGELYEPSPDYFFVNVIPHNIGELKTPVTIKTICDQWIENGYERLKEFAAYCLLRDYPIHRLLCLLGRGRNGKGQYEILLYRFIGPANIASADFDKICTSRFETAKLYKKLLCIMGEINFSKINNSSKIKQLTGKDVMSAERKNGQPFDYINYAKVLVIGNSLPQSEDTSDGFYSRWKIEEFKNQFQDGGDIIDTIPPEEYDQFATECVYALKNILENKKFQYDTTIAERAAEYKRLSNTLEIFCDMYLEKGDYGNIPTFEVRERFNAWASDRGFRQLTKEEFSPRLESLGYEKGKRKVTKEDGSISSWAQILGVRWKSPIITNEQTDLTGERVPL